VRSDAELPPLDEALDEAPPPDAGGDAVQALPLPPGTREYTVQQVRQELQSIRELLAP